MFKSKRITKEHNRASLGKIYSKWFGLLPACRHQHSLILALDPRDDILHSHRDWTRVTFILLQYVSEVI